MFTFFDQENNGAVIFMLNKYTYNNGMFPLNIYLIVLCQLTIQWWIDRWSLIMKSYSTQKGHWLLYKIWVREQVSLLELLLKCSIHSWSFTFLWHNLLFVYYTLCMLCNTSKQFVTSMSLIMLIYDTDTLWHIQCDSVRVNSNPGGHCHAWWPKSLGAQRKLQATSVENQGY